MIRNKFVPWENISTKLRGKNFLVLLFIFLIPVWQGIYVFNPELIQNDKKWKMRAASGIHSERGFAYFLYYLNLYPVAHDLFWSKQKDEVDYSVAGAEDLFKNHWGGLRTERNHTIRYGDHLKTYLYSFSAFLRGSPKTISIKDPAIIFFIISLMVCLYSFWRIGYFGMGFILVIIVGSNPFQLYETYVNENVFSWTISAALFILAINLPIISNNWKSNVRFWCIPIISALVLATLKNIRSEPAVVMLGCLLVYTFADVRIIKRLGLIFSFLLVFWASGFLWQSYFDYKIDEAKEEVAKVGGHVYEGPIDMHHMFWHSAWIGLGDFDRKYGHRWKDRVGARFALPILKEQYGIQIPPWKGTNKFEEYWDKNNKFYKTPYELPYYNEVLKNDIMYKIVNDPVWCITILYKRMIRILNSTSPIRAQIFNQYIEIPFHGNLVIILIIMLIILKKWFYLKLILFTLPVSTVALVVYSGKGVTNYSIYHFMAFTIILVALFKLLKMYFGKHSTDREGK